MKVLPCVLLLMASSASAQTAVPLLTSNRPGIAESEAVVGRGVLQLEGGIELHDVTWEQLTVRAGVSPRVEIFGGWNDGDDVLVGTKLLVLRENRQGVTLTISPAWSFPVSSGAQVGSLRLLWARSLPREWSLSGNVLFTRTSDAAHRYWENAAMAGVTRALTPTVSATAEVSTVAVAARPPAWTLDAGVAWVAAADLQWDVSAGHTLHHRGDDWFVSAGVTIRRR